MAITPRLAPGERVEHAERLGHKTSAEDAEPSIALIECSSIAKGYEVADAIAKRSPVRLLWVRTVSPGNHVTLFSGEVPETEVALEAGLAVAGKTCLAHMLIPNVHPDLVPAIRAPRPVDVDEALGIVETRTVASAIHAADRAAKTSEIELLEVRLAMHLGGKGFFVIAGALADVESAVAAAVEDAGEHLLRDVVIPRASQELLEHLFQ